MSSWWEKAIDFATDVFTGGGGSSWLGTAVKIGSEVYGAYTQYNAQQDASQIMQQGYADQTSALLAGNEAAQARLAALGEQTAGATDYLRRVVAHDPYTLTPGQQTGLEDTRRQARNSLAYGGLRGAGRAGVAAFNEADRRYTDAAYASNQARADAAAGQLSGQGFGVTQQAAGFDIATGRGVAGGAVPAADDKASSNLANAALKGSVVGTLSSFIANDQKDRSQDSKYQDWKTQQGSV